MEDDYEFKLFERMDRNKDIPWKHSIQDKILVIKDKVHGSVVVLDDVEIMNMLDALGILSDRFKQGFNY